MSVNDYTVSQIDLSTDDRWHCTQQSPIFLFDLLYSYAGMCKNAKREWVYAAHHKWYAKQSGTDSAVSWC